MNNSLMRRLDRANNLLTRFEVFLLSLSTLVLVGVIFVQVICRYVLFIPTAWAEELARYLFVWTSYLGSAYALNEGGHIEVDIVPQLAQKVSFIKNKKKFMNDLELAGICGAHFEDQVTPKRCGGMHGVQVESAEVFAKKIETAVKYRKDPNFLVIARSDAVEVTGVDDAIRRMNLAAAAGADMGFLFSAKGVCDNLDDIKRVVDGVKIPILYCLMEFCPEVCFTLDELKSVGLRAVCWPNGLLMRWCRAATDLVEEFKKTGNCGTFYNKLMPISECNELLGISDWNPPGMF